MIISIIGCGTMGSGIAQVFAKADHDVYLVGRTKTKANKSTTRIAKSLNSLVKKKKITSKSCQEIIKHIHQVDTVNPKSQLVIEAIPENLKLKLSLFKQLGNLPKSTILATNTSSLSVTKIASVCKHKQRVIGMHFMNPAPLLPLVELVKAKQTSTATIKKVKKIITGLNKTPVLVKDSPGFVLNRLLIPMINEGVILVEKGVAKPKDIDDIMVLGAKQPLGPLAIADLIGLDIVLDIMQHLHKKLDAKYKPAALLKKMVKQNHLGRKTKRGFYRY
ncbi:MAG: 3-hydroxyacyl-CoA dehydrogenase family protein [Candidatus Nanoarchaeia archaeon]